MSWDKFAAWDTITQLLASAQTWTGAQTFSGAVTCSADLSVTDQINLLDGTDTHIIKAVQETGLGGRLTIGLDETARTLVICDVGDIDTDLGLSVSSAPKLQIFNAGLSDSIYFTTTDIYSTTSMSYWADYFKYIIHTNVTGGNAVEFTTDGAGIELTDNNSEQSFVYIDPKINQSGTAAANAIKVNMTLTAEGDGSTGSGNNLLLFQVASVDKFRINNTGAMFTSIDEITATDAGVAASVATAKTIVTTNGDSDLDNVTLADGATGQVKSIFCEVAGNAADSYKITPAHMVGGTQITFAADPTGKGCILEWTASGWVVSGNNGGTIS